MSSQRPPRAKEAARGNGESPSGVVGSLSAAMRDRLSSSGARSGDKDKDKDKDKGTDKSRDKAREGDRDRQIGRGGGGDRAREGDRDKQSGRSGGGRRGDVERDALLKQKQAELASIKKEKAERFEAARGLIRNYQPGGGKTVEQKALELRYDPEINRWSTHRCLVHMDSKPLDEGGMRWCVRMMMDSRPDAGKDGAKKEMVCKFFKPDVFKGSRSETKSYFAEAMTQMHARYLADLFNKEVKRKRLQIASIRMVPASILVLVDCGNKLINLEPLLEGRFMKHNDNDGNITSKDPVPQAFSHFSFVASGGSVLVCDIQGVGSDYTDPQMHSLDGKGYGIGNIGKEGMMAFIKTHKCNGICQDLGLPSLEMPKALQEAKGVWSVQRFIEAMQNGIEKAGLNQQILQVDPKEEAEEKVRLQLLIAQKKLLIAKVAQQKAFLEASPRVSAGTSASPAPSHREAILTPTEQEAIEAKKAQLKAQIALKLKQLSEVKETGQASQGGSVSPIQGNDLEAQKRKLVELIAQKQAQLEKKRSTDAKTSEVEQSSPPKPAVLSGVNALSPEEIRAKKAEPQSNLLQMTAKTVSPLNGSELPTEPQTVAAPAFLKSESQNADVVAANASAANLLKKLDFVRSGMSSAGSSSADLSQLLQGLGGNRSPSLDMKFSGAGASDTVPVGDPSNLNNLKIGSYSAAPMAASSNGRMPMPDVGSSHLIPSPLSVNNQRATAYQVTSPARLLIKMPEERLLMAFRYTHWFAFFILLWAILSFFLGIFAPFGFPCWAMSVPVIGITIVFIRYCLPIQPPLDGITMPRSINYTILITVWAASFALAAGIISARGVESIKPLLETPVCMSPELWKEMDEVDGIASVNTPYFYGTDPEQPPIEPPIGGKNNAPVPSANAPVPLLPLANTPVPWSSTPASSTPTPVQLPTYIPKNQPPTLYPLEVSLIDMKDMKEKVGGCKAMNMCHDSGIKMLSCERLKGINEWNTFFFIMSSFTLPPLYFWVYYMISVRLREYQAALLTGFTEVQDLSFVACVARAFTYCWGGASSARDPTSAETEGGSSYLQGGYVMSPQSARFRQIQV